MKTVAAAHSQPPPSRLDSHRLLETHRNTRPRPPRPPRLGSFLCLQDHTSTRQFRGTFATPSPGPRSWRETPKDPRFPRPVLVIHIGLRGPKGARGTPCRTMTGAWASGVPFDLTEGHTGHHPTPLSRNGEAQLSAVLPLATATCPPAATPGLPRACGPPPPCPAPRDVRPRTHVCWTCDFTEQETVQMPETRADSSDTDDVPSNNPCQVLPFATVRPDARTKTWCRLWPKMEVWFSQADPRRLRTAPHASQSPRLPTEPQGTEPEPFPSCCPLRGQPLSRNTTVSLHRGPPFHASSRRPDLPRCWRGPRTCITPESRDHPRTSRQSALSQQQQQQQPARLLDPFFRQPQSSTASSLRSDSHDRPSSSAFLVDRSQRLPFTDHLGATVDSTREALDTETRDVIAARTWWQVWSAKLVLGVFVCFSVLFSYEGTPQNLPTELCMSAKAAHSELRYPKMWSNSDCPDEGHDARGALLRHLCSTMNALVIADLVTKHARLDVYKYRTTHVGLASPLILLLMLTL